MFVFKVFYKTNSYNNNIPCTRILASSNILLPPLKIAERHLQSLNNLLCLRINDTFRFKLQLFIIRNVVSRQVSPNTVWFDTVTPIAVFAVSTFAANKLYILYTLYCNNEVNSIVLVCTRVRKKIPGHTMQLVRDNYYYNTT